MQHLGGDPAPAPVSAHGHTADFGDLAVAQQPQRADHLARGRVDRHEMQCGIVQAVELEVARHPLLLAEDLFAQHEGRVEQPRLIGPVDAGRARLQRARRLSQRARP
ncbi:MAG TPA: hypothetical protein VMI13_10930 [Solirubrobacteraceae bacterium]|nr:hypothetical protein [Solirubrobacteraceae bacterium]